MERLPNDLDWVSKLAACNPETVFEQLSEMVKGDVEKRKEQLKAQGAAYSFEFKRDGPSFHVRILANLVSPKWIQFVLREETILVSNAADQVLAHATTALDECGECRLVVTGKSTPLWRFRHDVLKDFLFISPFAR